MIEACEEKSLPDIENADLPVYLNHDKKELGLVKRVSTCKDGSTFTIF